jgi:GNAT superfamily N-acetyltransferase
MLTINMETICDLKLIDFDTSMYQELWDTIIMPQSFYLQDVYYDLYGEMLPQIRPFNYEKLKLNNPRWLISLYGKRLENPCGKVLINQLNEIIGWMYWSESKKECYLKFFILRQDYQNKGIGSEWMGWLIHKFEHKIIGICFNYYNNGLKRFYASFGFKDENGTTNGPSGEEVSVYWSNKYQKKKQHKFLSLNIIKQIVQYINKFTNCY